MWWWNMVKCAETGCNDKATHTYKALDGLRIPLCDKHYKKSETYEYKPGPLKVRLRMRMVWLVKWFIRLMGILVLIPAGVLAIGFAVYTLVAGTQLLFDLNIGLIFFSFNIHLEDARIVSLIGIVTLLVGIALTYIGFKKME